MAIQQSSMFNPYQAGRPSQELAPGRRLTWRLASLISAGGFTFALTMLFMGMRGVMNLGGFVASGGPYAIAHPAPTWVWVMPVSIWVGLILIFANAMAVKRGGGLNLIALAWPALFLSLGWNFFEFGFNPPGGGPHWAWGWLVCGVVFFLMGGVPLLAVIGRWLPPRPGGREQAGDPGLNAATTESGAGREGHLLVALLQVAAALAGIWLAVHYFNFLNS